MDVFTKVLEPLVVLILEATYPVVNIDDEDLSMEVTQENLGL
jgi:hypothetical protein